MDRLEIKIITREASVSCILLPRLDLVPSDTIFFQILKKSYKIALLMTINKSQGEMFNYIHCVQELMFM